jgi:hypothetical protein
MADVLFQVVPPKRPAALAKAFHRTGYVAERASCGSFRVLVTQSALAKAVCLDLNVRFDLRVEVVLSASAPKHGH